MTRYDKELTVIRAKVNVVEHDTIMYFLKLGRKSVYINKHKSGDIKLFRATAKATEYLYTDMDDAVTKAAELLGADKDRIYTSVAITEL